jgi:hypothetical protein
MATQTDFLKLVKPVKGEFTDAWHIPINANADRVETWAKPINDEIVAARHTLPSLVAFLDVGHNADGTLLATAEVVSARSSPLFGDKTAAGDASALRNRLNYVDLELLHARENRSSLRAAMAAHAVLGTKMVVSGSADANGFATWLSFSANRAQINATTTELVLMIDGYLTHIRADKNLTIAATGVNYLYADFQADGVTTVDGDSVFGGAALAANGVTSFDTDTVPRIFTDSTVSNWTAKDVKVGDTLRLLDSGDLGDYVVSAVGVSGDLSKLRIVGRFPVGSLASINYVIKDPLAVVVGSATSEVALAGRIFIGEADFSGGAVTAVRARHFKDTYIGNWQQVTNIVTNPPSPDWFWNHNLGSTDLHVSVQVSSANDGTAAIEQLPIMDFSDSIAIGNGTLAVGLGTLNLDPSQLTLDTTGVSATTTVTPSTGTATAVTTIGVPGSPIKAKVGGSDPVTGAPALSGAVAKTGAAAPTGAVKMQWTRNQVRVKPTVTGVFYRDYSGATQVAGYIRVVVRKRGQ